MFSYFTDCGLVMYLVLLSGFAALIVDVLQMVRIKKSNLIVLIAVLFAVTFLMGQLGSITSIFQLLAAIHRASPSQRLDFFSFGLAISLRPMIIASVLLIIHTILGGIAAHKKINIDKEI